LGHPDGVFSSMKSINAATEQRSGGQLADGTVLKIQPGK